jgi:hypothetical protein
LEMLSAKAIATDKEGFVYVAGIGIDSDDNYNLMVVKYDAAGVEQWTARQPGPAGPSAEYYTAVALAVDAEGNVYVTGESEGVDALSDYLTVKYNQTGQEVWTARYDGTGDAVNHSTGLALDPQGNVIVTGYSMDESGKMDAVTIKYAKDGTRLWEARLDGFDASSGRLPDPLAVDRRGNVYLATAIGQWTIVKYDGEGRQLWTAAKARDDSVLRFYFVDALVLDSVGNVFVMGGSIGSSTFDYDWATVKYDAEGNELWSAGYNGPADGLDRARGIAVDVVGNAYVTGTRDLGHSKEYLTIKYDGATGGELWLAHYGPSSVDETAWAVALDDRGNAYVTGTSPVDFERAELATIQYKPSIALTLMPDTSVLPPEGTLGYQVTGSSNSSDTECFDYWSHLQSSGAQEDSLLDELYGPYHLCLDAFDSVQGQMEHTIPVHAALGEYEYRAFVGEYPMIWHEDRFLFHLSPVTVAASTDVDSVPRGGTLGYKASGTNITASDQCFDYWTDVTLPNGMDYPVANELIGPIHLCLRGRDEVSAFWSHLVPLEAPWGTYRYNAFVGAYPDVWHEDQFAFGVTDGLVE